MKHALLSLFAAAVAVVPALAQKRSGAPKELTFTDAVAAAQKAVEAGDIGSAISALQAAIRDLQKKQRVALLAALPKPDGFTIRDDEPNDGNNPFAAGLAIVGSTITRHYEGKDGKNMNVEVTANSPLISMMSMFFTNPAVAKADGAEIVEYGQHKALLKKSGDDGQELTIVLFDKHMVKVTATSMTADQVFAIFDQAAVDRLEKPLGK